MKVIVRTNKLPKRLSLAKTGSNQNIIASIHYATFTDFKTLRLEMNCGKTTTKVHNVFKFMRVKLHLSFKL